MSSVVAATPVAELVSTARRAGGGDRAPSRAAPAPARALLDGGAHVQAGWKPPSLGADQVNQDTCFIVTVLPEVMVVGVFDGHGKHGQVAAHKARDLFAGAAMSFGAASPSELPGALRHAFQAAHALLGDQAVYGESGTTATVAVINAAVGTVTCAHVGDSTLRILRGSETQFETQDHDFSPDDVARCRASGGDVREIRYCPTKTVRRLYVGGTHSPGLALARSLGDLDAHSVGCLAEPAVHVGVPFHAGSTLIAASDGTWNVMSGAEAARAAAAPSAQAGAQALVQEARLRWPPDDYTDDICAVVVRTLPRK